jgi:hypothetical protein
VATAAIVAAAAANRSGGPRMERLGRAVRSSGLAFMIGTTACCAASTASDRRHRRAASNQE